ncbi:hypothetical protein [Candidatus Epulonipiscium viviparus]|nr:hypothetical protein [Candidatus Epulopiscium viviparus]
MTVVVTCYILVAPEGFGAIATSVFGSIKIAELAGVAIGIAAAALAYIAFNKKTSS